MKQTKSYSVKNVKHPISIDKLGSTPNVFMPLFNCWYINMYDKNTTEQSIKKYTNMEEISW